MSIYIICLVPMLLMPACIFAWSAYCLAVNKAIAKKTGLPVIAIYITPTNPLRLMFANFVIDLLQYFPFDTQNLTRFYAHGWEANERFRAHQEYSEAFIVASPGGNYLYICNPEAVQEILHRKTDFQRDVVRMSILNVYGKNISTTEGGEWQIHRKATAAAFTESNNEAVWKESLKQAEEMLYSWKNSPSQPVRTVARDTRTFTLNVLAAALFSKHYPFELAKDEKTLKRVRNLTDHSVQYRDSLSKILRSIIPIFIFGSKKLRDTWWIPKTWRQAGEAVYIFRSYVNQLIVEERANKAQTIEKHDLVSNLVRACETEEQHTHGHHAVSTTAERAQRRTLTENEIISNIFVYAFAGNDTTAITLAHVLVHLAAYPETQDWISEEIKYYTDSKNASSWDYSVFPKLKRCLAVMMETLRLCHPLGQLIKTTGEQHQYLPISNKTFILPKSLNVNINLAAIHTLPRIWGKQSLYWNPARFICFPENGPWGIENEILLPDTTTNFLPWAYGQKACPGKRFSQVELVAALAALFRDHVVRPYPEVGETQAQANKRAANIAMEIEKKLLNEMKNSSLIGLIWERRKEKGG